MGLIDDLFSNKNGSDFYDKNTGRDIHNSEMLAVYGCSSCGYLYSLTYGSGAHAPNKCPSCGGKFRFLRHEHK
jgi:rubrerythrin